MEVTQLMTSSPGVDIRISELCTAFDDNLMHVAPYLHNLAEQITADRPDLRWNVMIGDDTSGRLPVHFLKHVLQGQNIFLPTFYIQAGRRARSIVSEQSYANHVERIRDRIGMPLRAVIVSDVAASGDTLNFLKDTLYAFSEQVDTAVVASRYEVQNQIGDSFVGAVGRGAVLNVNRTFESVDVPENATPMYAKLIQRIVPGRIRKVMEPLMPSIMVDPTTYPLTNVEADLRPGAPTAKRSADQTYRELANHCYERMQDLAEAHATGRPESSRNQN